MALTTTEEALVRQLLDQQAAILSLASSESTIISKLGATKVTLADLTSASSIDDADLFLIRQGTTEKNVSGAILKAIGSQPDASETIKGIIEIATAAEAQALSSNVVAITPARLSSAFGGSNQSLAANGYQKLPSGLIIQWGQVTASAAGVAVTFPVAFPSACQSLVISSVNSAVTTSLPLATNIPTTTGFTAYSASANPGTHWIAIGY